VVIQNAAPLADPAGARVSFALMNELAAGLKYEFTTETAEVVKAGKR
jgi:hypothetical protein